MAAGQLSHQNPEAMVIRGGVSLAEINPKTMESRLVSRLFFVGEILDIDGDTGGYNLQAAFSTAALPPKGSWSVLRNPPDDKKPSRPTRPPRPRSPESGGGD